jgi:sulfate transport system permease protein
LPPSNPLPGFSITLGFTIIYLTVIVLVPIGALALKALGLSWKELWELGTNERAMAAYELSLGASLAAALINAAFGSLLAWVLARYSFPGRRLLDGLIDFPFALPTAVAGLTLASLFSDHGWLGQYLAPLGIKGAFSRLGVVIALTFVGLPFSVRTIQPEIESLDQDVQEAAKCLGAGRWRRFAKVTAPTLLPTVLTGFGLSFARPDAGGHAAGSVRLYRGHLRGVGAADLLFRAAADPEHAARLGGQIQPTMNAPADAISAAPAKPAQRAARDPVHWLLITVALLFAAVFLVLPLANVFAQALAAGFGPYWRALAEPDTLSAIRLTMIIAAVSVPLNAVFGVAASWAISKFEFRGKTFLLSLIDLPFSISPVVAGLLFVLLFGVNGLLGHWLEAHHVRILFALPGMVLATIFVTFPYVARELIPIMRTQGREQEEAALTLGASGWKTFWHVTLPSVKWGLFYGIVLCNARAMGEFGAVSVVSGHIAGQTDTLPLRVEKLYNEFDPVAPFAVATLLALLALATMLLKALLEWKTRHEP